MPAYVEVILKKFDVLFKWVSIALLAGMVCLIFTQVIFRYILLLPLPWSEEAAMYLFIWLTFIAGYVAARRNNHIGVSALQDALPPLPGKILKSLSSLVCTVFFLIIVYYTSVAWPRLYMQRSPALQIPIAFVYLCMIIGSAFMAFWYLCQAVNTFKSNGAEVDKI